jgi:hypothetical protein
MSSAERCAHDFKLRMLALPTTGCEIYGNTRSKPEIIVFLMAFLERAGRLRMVRINSEIGEKKRLAAWLWTPSIGLNRHKHRIDLG